MGAARKTDLTPGARLERAKRRLADDIDELVDAKLAAASAANPFYDQGSSPVGHRRHLFLARKGLVPSKKDARRVLILKDDLHAYIEREGLSRGKRDEDDDVDDIADNIVRRSRK